VSSTARAFPTPNSRAILNCKIDIFVWGAHAARVLVSAARRNNLFYFDDGSAIVDTSFNAEPQSSRSRRRDRQHERCLRSQNLLARAAMPRSAAAEVYNS
jgi:hypothetical protein